MANQHIFNNTLIITGSVTASDGFYGDGSGLTGITAVAEWDGTRDGDAEITGSLIVSGSSVNVDFTNTTGVSGSFSGSFSGDGSGLTGVLTELPTGLVSSSQQISYTGITDVPSGLISSSLQFNTLSDPFTGSFTGSFVGDGSGLTGIIGATGVYEIGSGLCSIQPAPALLNASALGSYSNIGGGQNNTTLGTHSTVGGGCINVASGSHSTIAGGQNNVADCFFSTIGGGQSNTVSQNYGTVGGGVSNTASNYMSTIGGGICNTASGHCSTIGGGANNIASGACSTIGGGSLNEACGCRSTIAGGYLNTINSNCSTIAGGCLNTINSIFSGILGGNLNHTCGYANSFIIGSNLCATAACYTFVNNLCNIGGGTSDCRLKENIKPVSYGLSELSRLEPVSYNFKTDDSKATKYGFLAQCVQEIMPELIKYHPTETVDGDKVLQFEKEAIWVSMINAIKELKNRVNVLESKNN